MKPAYFLCSLAACLFLQLSFGQDTSSLKRKPYKLHIAVNEKTSYEEELPSRDFVYPNNSVQLYPGETVFLEATVTNGKITKLRAVPSVKDSSTTIIASFSQSTKDNDVHEMMMLKVVNPFAEVLSYRAMVLILNQNKFVFTSILPIPGKLAGFETWADIIVSIGLQDWELK